MSFIAELKRRNVFRVGAAYAVAAWILLQALDVVGEILELPPWGGKLILVLVVVGFFLALFFAWAFELTPEGLKRDHEVDRSDSIAPQTGRKLDRTIIVLMGLALVYFVWESRFMDRDAASTPPEPAGTAAVEAEAGETARAAAAETGEAGAVSAATPTPAPAVNEKSIAVLPFTNRSPNPDDIYFTDGVHDDLLTQLAKLNAFSVISRTSVLEYRDTAKNLREIAAELGVANVMEGAVQRAGSRVRINVQLIDADTDEHLWAEVYDRELTTENLFDIQSEIAKAIAAALQATLTDEEIAAVAEAPTDNVEAYELYQQARRFTLGETEIGYDTAIDLYEEALALDPGFKLAWTGLSKAHLTNYWSYGGDPEDRDKARQALDEARALDDDFPELFLAEGAYWYWGFLDYDRAIPELEKAIALMPGNAEAHMWLGWARRRDGQWEAAIAAMRESLRLDPLVMIHWSEISNTLSLVKRQQEALAAAEKTYELAPDSYWARATLGEQITRMTGDTDRAVRLLVGAQHTGDPAFIGYFIGTNLRARNFDEVLAAIDLLTPELEVARTGLFLKESQRAWTLRLAGREEEAREQALAALQRIGNLARDLGYDYRFSMAKARAFAVLGDTDSTREMVAEARATHPTDAVEEAVVRWNVILSLAAAGLDEEAIALLDEHLSSPSYETAQIVRVAPAFDGLRGDPAFEALLERHE